MSLGSTYLDTFLFKPESHLSLNMWSPGLLPKDYMLECKVDIQTGATAECDWRIPHLPYLSEPIYQNYPLFISMSRVKIRSLAAFHAKQATLADAFIFQVCLEPISS